MTSTARSILRSAAGQDLAGHPVDSSGLGGDEGAHAVAAGHPRDVVGLVEVEDHDRQVVLHAQGDRRRVEHLELVAEDVVVAEALVAGGGRVLHRVRVVDAVHLGGLEQDLGVDLHGAQRRGRVGGEVRVAGAGDEDRHAALLEVAHGAPADVRLRDLVHRDGATSPARGCRPARCASWRARPFMTVASMPM